MLAKPGVLTVTNAPLKEQVSPLTRPDHCHVRAHASKRKLLAGVHLTLAVEIGWFLTKHSIKEEKTWTEMNESAVKSNVTSICGDTGFVSGLTNLGAASRQQ